MDGQQDRRAQDVDERRADERGHAAQIVVDALRETLLLHKQHHEGICKNLTTGDGESRRR